MIFFNDLSVLIFYNTNHFLVIGTANRYYQHSIRVKLLNQCRRDIWSAGCDQDTIIVFEVAQPSVPSP